MPFKELKDFLFSNLYQDKLLKAMPFNKISDLACVIDFNHKKTKFHLIFGPTSKSDIDNKFGEQKKDIVENGIIVDIDCFLENTESASVKNFFKFSNENSQDILARILDYIKGC
jgi:hypothetical protein